MLHLWKPWGPRSLPVDAWPHQDLPRRWASLSPCSSPCCCGFLLKTRCNHPDFPLRAHWLEVEEKVPHNLTLEVPPSWGPFHNAFPFAPLQPSFSLEGLNRGSRSVSSSGSWDIPQQWTHLSLSGIQARGSGGGWH